MREKAALKMENSESEDPGSKINELVTSLAESLVRRSCNEQPEEEKADLGKELIQDFARLPQTEDQTLEPKLSLKSLTGIDDEKVMKLAKQYAMFAKVLGVQDERIEKAMAALGVIQSLLNETLLLIEDLSEIMSDEERSMAKLTDVKLIMKASALTKKYVELYNVVAAWIKDRQPCITGASAAVETLEKDLE